MRDVLKAMRGHLFVGVVIGLELPGGTSLLHFQGTFARARDRTGSGSGSGSGSATSMRASALRTGLTWGGIKLAVVLCA